MSPVLTSALTALGARLIVPPAPDKIKLCSPVIVWSAAGAVTTQPELTPLHRLESSTPESVTALPAPNLSKSPFVPVHARLIVPEVVTGDPPIARAPLEPAPFTVTPTEVTEPPPPPPELRSATNVPAGPWRKMRCDTAADCASLSKNRCRELGSKVATV